MELKIGPFLISITRPRPPSLDRVTELTEIATELLDTAALLRPAVLQMLDMELPEESHVFLQVVLHPHHLLACKSEDAIRALRHVSYLAVETGIASYSSLNRL
jgi:hypothetical protein